MDYSNDQNFISLYKYATLYKYESSGLEFKKIKGGTYSVKSIGSCTDTRIVIPSEYNGRRVTEIGNFAFDKCSSITKVSLPDSITRIGRCAFRGCSGITSINIPDGVRDIDFDAFSGCINLLNIIIPDSVTSIGSDAFEDTKFYNDSINWTDDVLYIGKHLIKAKETLVGNYTIKNDTISIAGRAFKNCNKLTNIVIPNSIKDIGNGAFSQCTSLSSISIPETITIISSDLFYRCKELKSVTIPSSVTRIDGFAFADCTGLTDITIPDSVTRIGNYAFSGCTGLSNIVIPDSVTSIGRHAFNGCVRLEGIRIPEKVMSIEYNPFSNCASLVSISVSPNNEVYYSQDNCIINKATKELVVGCKSSVIPDDVTSIGAFSFYDCLELKHIIIPEGVNDISFCAFSNCFEIESLSVSPNNSVYYSEGNCIIERETQGLILGCKNSIIPNTVKSIFEFAFSGCRNLTSISIPNSVINIDENAFSCCLSLKYIYCEAKRKPIGFDPNWLSGCAAKVYWGGKLEVLAYEYDSSSKTYTVTGINDPTVARIDIPSNYNGDAVENIYGIYTENRLAVTDITIPDSIISIDPCIFYNSPFLASVSVSKNNQIYYSQYNCIIEKATKKLILACRNSSIPSDILSIGDFAFVKSVGLTEIRIPDSVTSIGSYAFSGCVDLTSIIIPISVKELGECAFCGCDKLKEIHCAAECKPDGWDDCWDDGCEAQIKWGVKCIV